MQKKFLINNTEFTFSFSDEVDIKMLLEKNEEGISLYKISFKWEKLSSPNQITLSYSIPCVNMYTLWDPLEKLRFIPFGDKQITNSRLGYGMPLKGVLSRNGNNSCLLAISDVKSPIALRMKSHSSQAAIDVYIDFFTMLTGPFQSYETLLRIDERCVDFCDAIYDARAWFESLGYQNAYIPQAAKQPMYSTWYSYRLDITDADVIKECEFAAKMGMKAVIIDDGWQTDDASTIYGDCGDWKPIPHKFHDVRTLTEKIHSLGMKVILWYSVAFVGKYSENYKRFEGMYLRYFENTECYALDPRYKKVRDFLKGIYADAVRKWGLDGLKLDYIDRFKTNGELSDEMDFVSVEEAVEQLLKDISLEIREINPEILIEFRQPYFGPVISAYGNMMRVWDCPLDGVMNKNQTLNLRLVSGKCAVHSDMICWHSADSAGAVALQLWGTLFSVPQISVRLKEISKEQRAVLENYLTFWNTHRTVLMDGRINVKFCENGYGYAESAYENELVASLSSSNVFESVGDFKEYYVINLTDREYVIIKNPKCAMLTCKVFDCLGETLGTLTVSDPLSEIDLPIGGRVEITVCI